MAMRKTTRCKYPECRNWYYTKVKSDYVNKHFYKIPKNNDKRKLWLTACKIDDSVKSKWYAICEDHFELSAFRNETKNRLNFNAVPKPFSGALCNLNCNQLPDEKKAVNSTNSTVDSTCSNPCTTSLTSLNLPGLSFSQKSNSTSVILKEHNYCTNKINVETQLSDDMSHLENSEVMNNASQIKNELFHVEKCEVIINCDNGQEHNYITPLKENLDKQKINVDFLIDGDGIVSKIKFTRPNLTSNKRAVYKTDRITFSKM